MFFLLSKCLNKNLEHKLQLQNRQKQDFKIGIKTNSYIFV